MTGREGDFKWPQVPSRFKEYGKPQDEGGFGVKLGQKPQGKALTSDKVRSTASKLRTALDVHKFVRSPRWSEFLQDCNELHRVLLAKVEAMQAHATSEAERREANKDKPATLTPSFIPPNLSGTPLKYAALEALLQPMGDYEVLSLPEEECLKLHPLSDAAMAGKDQAANRRSHLLRWRKEMVFQSFAVETLQATWGSQLKLSLFMWRVPIDEMARSSLPNTASQVAAIAHVDRQLPIIRGRYARQQFLTDYSRVTGLGKGMLANMYALLSSDGQAVNSSEAKAMEMKIVEFIANNGDVELWPDLRALNGNDGSKYDLFWEEGDKYLAELETLASGNRHGQQRSLQQPLSVPDFTRQVEQRLREAGHADAAIPGHKWVGFQFHPRRPASGVAKRYTGRWEIKLKVLCTSRLVPGASHLTPRAWCLAARISHEPFETFGAHRCYK